MDTETSGTDPDEGTHDTDRAEELVERRSELLPEEQAAGSADAHDQARAILAESEERTEHPEETGATSVQTSTPDERPS